MIVQFGNTIATQSMTPVTLFPWQGIKCPSLWPMKVVLFHNHGKASTLFYNNGMYTRYLLQTAVDLEVLIALS